MELIDTVVIGGGVVGLAAGLAVAQRGRSVCVLEREPRPGMGTSTHNSQVIHAGIYYPPARSRRATASRAPGCSTTSAPATACRTRAAAS